MASVFQRNWRWYMRFKNASGNWTKKATAARTKTEALRLANDLERLAEQQRLGLSPAPIDPTITLSDLCNWWLNAWCRPASLSRERSRLGRHVMHDPIGRIPLRSLTASQLEGKLRSMEQIGLSAPYVNGLRRVLKAVFNRASNERPPLWVGTNPVNGTVHRDEPKPKRDTLSSNEVGRFLAALPQHERNVFATAVLAGLRKGELCGLRREDADLEAGTIRVARSYNRQTTKGGHTDHVPISELLNPYLQNAMQSSPSDLVFPDKSGQMRDQNWKPGAIMKRALARARIVNGYDHVCRRCKSRNAPYSERANDAKLRHCPKCGMKLWPKPLPRRIRFHDLRGTCGTLQSRAGAPLPVTQRTLRHRDPEITDRYYLHHGLEEQRTYLNRMIPKRDAQSIAALAPAVAEDPPSLVPIVSPAYENVNGAASPSAQNHAESQRKKKKRETRIGLATLSLGS